MTRYVVAYEGKHVDDNPNVYLERNSLVVLREPIHVTWGFDYERVIGLAREFQRDEETGEVSFEITWGPEDRRYYEKANKFSLSILLDFESRVGNVKHVHTGSIVGLAVLGFSQD